MADEGAAKDATLVAWSLVYGYTSLCIKAGIENADMRLGRPRLFADADAALAQR